MSAKARITPGAVLLHTSFWVVVWFFFFYLFSYNSENRYYVTWFSTLLLPLTMLVTYFSVYFLIPRYLLTKKYGLFFLYAFYMLVFSSYMVVLVIYGSLIVILKWDASQIPPMIKNFLFILILVYVIVGVVSLVAILNSGFRTQKLNRELENKFLSAQLQLKEQELAYLKKQIHPHFLFNALNTIYGFALKKSDRTTELIMKLSELLDYILYQVEQPRVLLREEIKHINDYLELERTRFEDSLRVTLEVEEIPGDIRIAPMLLMPLVENALKHGGYEDGVIDIRMTMGFHGPSFRFRIDNSHKPENTESPAKGIGLENLRKRLELHYPGRYSLEVEAKKDRYLAELTIGNLDSHD